MVGMSLMYGYELVLPVLDGAKVTCVGSRILSRLALRRQNHRLHPGNSSNHSDATTLLRDLMFEPDGNLTNPFLKRDPKWTPIIATLEAASNEFRYAFGTITVKRVEVISDKDD